ncbi:chorismate synthase [Lachnotalea glycerini]|uniref:Chorismate synthase n=1 Tax=Lachnotalea glycerini TaxID=1763509 RepID=A0A318EX80_9FIRM|nr:chorismate synthase [Lachnotalea glycerini]PXV95847.1 chorismate synthase [Lachnotalea glycerini]RDY33095.1 chorismate synthase [Lachnotalea glycerini]
MSGSILGNLFTIATWGESHGKGIGVVVDGCPAGLNLCEEDIQLFLNRRKPGQSKFSTPRKEEDSVEILSGVFDGKTTGTPISLIIYNQTQRSGDYSEIANYYRPGHADLTYDVKYGFRDYRGGGRSSGRETIGRVAAGAIASKILNTLGIDIFAYTKSIGPFEIHTFDRNEIMNNSLYMPDANTALDASSYLEECIKNHNSAGGKIECIISNLPAGVGEPAFEKLNANLAKAVTSIGAVKAFEIGDGIEVATATGLSNNDAYQYDENSNIIKLSNHSGGILGGISDGTDILLRASIKPTPSIAASQKTINKSGENININIKGRHDPIIVPRAVVVVESMVAVTVLDMLFMSMTSNMDSIKRFWEKR